LQVVAMWKHSRWRVRCCKEIGPTGRCPLVHRVASTASRVASVVKRVAQAMKGIAQPLNGRENQMRRRWHRLHRDCSPCRRLAHRVSSRWRGVQSERNLLNLVCFPRKGRCMRCRRVWPVVQDRWSSLKRDWSGLRRVSQDLDRFSRRCFPQYIAWSLSVRRCAASRRLWIAS